MRLSAAMRAPVQWEGNCMLKRPVALAAAMAASLTFSTAYAQQCDAGAGEKLFARCKACHNVEDAKNGVGPHLVGIVGRTIASVEDYKYSDAMREYAASEGGIAWDHSHLAAYLENPRGVVKGTKMAFAGLKKPDERDAVICYLDTLK
jgi:cytochrome c2